jgi:DNA-binding PadR family transcriptional regulator
MYVEILILAHLADRPGHGYEIKKRVERILGGSVALNNNLLYPALRRFEEMGAVRRTVEQQQGKPSRNTYSLTETGAEVLQSLLRDFPPEVARDETEFLTRVAFFDLLDLPTRLEILAARRTALHGHLAHLQRMVILAGDAPSPYGPAVISFLEDQMHRELDWIATLTQREERASTAESPPAPLTGEARQGEGATRISPARRSME